MSITKAERDELTIEPHGPATQEQLEDLHRAVAESLLAYFKRVSPEKRRAQMVMCAINFLKANSVKKSVTERATVGDTLESLADADMPFDVDYH